MTGAVALIEAIATKKSQAKIEVRSWQEIKSKNKHHFEHIVVEGGDGELLKYFDKVLDFLEKHFS